MSLRPNRTQIALAVSILGIAALSVSGTRCFGSRADAQTGAAGSSVIRYAATIDLPTLAAAGTIKTAALTPDGHWLAYGRDDDTIVLFDLRTRRPAETLKGNILPQVTEDHSYARATLAISPDARYVAAGGYVTSGFIDHQGVAKSVTRLWKLGSAAQLRVWEDVAPELIAFAPDERHLVVRSPAMTDTKDTTWMLDAGSGDVKSWVAQWSERDGDYFLDCKLVGFDRARVVFAKDVTYLLVVSDGGGCPKPYYEARPLRLWPLGSRIAGAPFAGPRLKQTALVALTTDGRKAVTFDGGRISVGFPPQSGELDLWDLATRRILVRGPKTTPLDDRWAEVTEFVAAGERALGLVLIDTTRTGNRDRYELVVWNLRSGELVARTARRVALDDSHLLLRADGRRAYVTTPAGLDVWQLSQPAGVQ